MPGYDKHTEDFPIQSLNKENKPKYVYMEGTYRNAVGEQTIYKVSLTVRGISS